MAIGTADLNEYISAITTDRLASNTVALQFVDRRFQDEFVRNRAYKVQIPTYDSTKNPDTDGTLTTLARGGNWPTADEDDISFKSLTADQQLAVARFVPWRDQLESPLNAIAKGVEVATHRMMVGIDTDVWAQWIAGTKAANITTLATSKTVSAAGAVAGSAEDDIFGWPTDLELEAYDAGFGPDSMTPFMRFMIMPPPVFVALRNELLDRDYADALNVSTLRSGNIMVPGAARSLRAMLNETMIFVTDRLPTFTSGSHTYYQIIAGTNRALTYVFEPVLTQSFDPQSNQVSSEPGYLFRSIIPFGRSMLDDRQAFVYRVKKV